MKARWSICGWIQQGNVRLGGPAIHGDLELMKSAQALTPQVTPRAQERAQNAALLILPAHLLQVHRRVRERGIEFGVRPSFLMGG